MDLFRDWQGPCLEVGPVRGSCISSGPAGDDSRWMRKYGCLSDSGLLERVEHSRPDSTSGQTSTGPCSRRVSDSNVWDGHTGCMNRAKSGAQTNIALSRHTSLPSRSFAIPTSASMAGISLDGDPGLRCGVHAAWSQLVRYAHLTPLSDMKLARQRQNSRC